MLADVARHIGDVVAAVAAPTRAEARAAAQAVEVEYEELPAVFDALEALDAPPIHEQSVVGGRGRPRSRCARSRAPTSATASASATATSPRASRRPRSWSRRPTAWPAPRTPRWSRTPPSPSGRTAASRCGAAPRPRSTCAATSPAASASPRTTSASSPRRWAARSGPRPSCGSRRSSPPSPARPGEPVKAVLDRGEEFVTLNRHPAVVKVRIGARRDGTLTAKEVDCWADTGAYADCGPGVATKMGYAGVGPYRIPHVRVDSHGRSTRTCRPTAPSAATAPRSRCGRPSARWTCWRASST